MTDAAGLIISAVVNIKRVCDDASSTKKVLKEVGLRMNSLERVVRRIVAEGRYREDDEAGRAVLDVLRELRAQVEKTRAVVVRAGEMGRIAYVMRAKDVHEDLKNAMEGIQFTLSLLEASQNHSLQREVLDFRRDAERRAEEMEALRLSEMRQKEALVEALLSPSSSSTSSQAIAALIGPNADASNAAGSAASSSSSLEAELADLRRERNELRRDVRAAREARDSVARDKAAAEEREMEQIIAALSVAASATLPSPSASAGPSALPEWTQCPINCTLMNDPVVVDSKCAHTVNLDAALRWIEEGGHRTCPVCNSNLRSRHLSPNSQLRDAIEAELESRGLAGSIAAAATTAAYSSTQSQPAEKPSRDESPSQQDQQPPQGQHGSVQVDDEECGQGNEQGRIEIEDGPPPSSRCAPLFFGGKRRLLIAALAVLLVAAMAAILGVVLGTGSADTPSPSSPFPDGTLTAGETTQGPENSPAPSPLPSTDEPTSPPVSASKPVTSAVTQSPTAEPTAELTALPTRSPTVAPLNTECIPSLLKLLPDDGAADDRFGISVAVNGDTLVIGAPYDDDNGSGSGGTYVFTRTGTPWAQQAKLLPDDGASGDNFGWSVGLDGDTVVIGAYGDDDNGYRSGSAYVFTRTGTSWAQQAKLLPNDGAADDRFGTSVAVDGDTVVIGANGDNDNGDFSGSAYLFTRTGTTWAQQAKLLPNDGAADDEFGTSVAVDGDIVVIGAYGDDDNGDWSGSAYVFTRTGTAWAQQSKLLPNDGAASDWFGRSVSLDGNTAVIGAYRDDDNGDKSGSAYVFTRTGTAWAQQTKLLPNDGAAGDYFGRSVSLDGSTAVIGADQYNTDGSGKVYVFTRSGTAWSQQEKLLPDDGAGGDRFGFSVAVDGNTVFVGAYADDNDNGEDSGGAYSFELC